MIYQLKKGQLKTSHARHRGNWWCTADWLAARTLLKLVAALELFQRPHYGNNRPFFLSIIPRKARHVPAKSPYQPLWQTIAKHHWRWVQHVAKRCGFRDSCWVSDCSWSWNLHKPCYHNSCLLQDAFKNNRQMVLIVRKRLKLDWGKIPA